MSYKHYLQSKHWRDKKTELYNAKAYKCYFCGKGKSLHAHHITYENIGKEILEDLIYLCRKHHTYVHKSFEAEKVQAWLRRIRKRNIKQRIKFGKKPFKKRYKFMKKKKRSRRYFVAKFSKRTQKKNHAGLFTWKANEKTNTQTD